jgi:hypothetical protein
MNSDTSPSAQTLTGISRQRRIERGAFIINDSLHPDHLIRSQQPSARQAMIEIAIQTALRSAKAATVRIS